MNRDQLESQGLNPQGQRNGECRSRSDKRSKNDAEGGDLEDYRREGSVDLPKLEEDASEEQQRDLQHQR